MIAWAATNLLATTLLVAIVLLLREPVARLFGARAAYALWLAPLVRMVMPPLPANAPVPGLQLVPEALAALPGIAALPPATDWGRVALVVWLSGAFLFLAYHALAHRRFIAKALCHGHRYASPDATGPEVIESKAVEGPIATGFLHPRIFLPAGFGERLDSDQQRLAVEHELMHHRRGDLASLAASLAMLALHWFNPLAYVAHRLFRRDLEAACDAHVAQALCPAERADYARAIIGCAAARVPEAICTLTTVDDLKRRLAMLDRRHGRTARLAGLGCAILVAAAGLAIAPLRAAPVAGKVTLQVNRIHVDTAGKVTASGAVNIPVRDCETRKVDAKKAPARPGATATPRFFLCGKPGGSDAEVADGIDRAIPGIAKLQGMTPERKAAIIAQLRAKAAELRGK